MSAHSRYRRVSRRVLAGAAAALAFSALAGQGPLRPALSTAAAVAAAPVVDEPGTAHTVGLEFLHGGLNLNSRRGRPGAVRPA